MLEALDDSASGQRMEARVGCTSLCLQIRDDHDCLIELSSSLKVVRNSYAFNERALGSSEFGTADCSA